MIFLSLPFNTLIAQFTMLDYRLNDNISYGSKIEKFRFFETFEPFNLFVCKIWWPKKIWKISRSVWILNWIECLNLRGRLCHPNSGDKAIEVLIVWFTIANKDEYSFLYAVEYYFLSHCLTRFVPSDFCSTCSSDLMFCQIIFRYIIDS